MAFLNRGVTLKALLENPELLNPPKLNDGGGKKDDFIKKDPNASQPVRPNQSAFLGPQLWDKTLPYDLMAGEFKDFKLEYMDLDEFFNENDSADPLNDDLNQLVDPSVVSGVNNAGTNLNTTSLPSPPHHHHTGPASPPQGPRLLQNLLASETATASSSPGALVANNVLGSAGLLDASMLDSSNDSVPNMYHAAQSPDHTEQSHSPIARSQKTTHHSTSRPALERPSNKRVWSPNTTRHELSKEIPVEHSELVLASVPDAEDLWEDEFDPKQRIFSVEELRPQPVIKKSRKVFVPEDLKDDRYWSRRTKNNVAAKRSRDARRVKENQIALRAGFLERENEKLVSELAKMREENNLLRLRLNKYEPQSP